MKEVWKSTLEGWYEISSLGRFRRAKEGRSTFVGRVRKAVVGRKGYYYVGASLGEKRVSKAVHVLVAAAFIGPRPKKKEVHHRDENKRNNVYTNLEYVTKKRNIQLAAESGKMGRFGDTNGRSKLLVNDVISIRVLASKRISQRALASKFGVSQAVINSIVLRKTWGHVA